MTAEEKLLEWCNEDFNFDTQKWRTCNIPDEILDCVLTVMEQWWPKFDDGCKNDFIDDFIFERIENSKYGKITKLCLKGYFEDMTKGLFD